MSLYHTPEPEALKLSLRNPQKVGDGGKEKGGNVLELMFHIKK